MPVPQLYLTLEAAPGAATAERLTAALRSAAIASVRLVSPLGAPLDVATARPLVELIQARDVAALISDDAQLCRTLRADGVHLSPGDGQTAAFAEAREVLGQRYIVGGEVARSRHDAMALGELGADYLAFSGADRDDFVAWWAEIFEVPCVGLNTADPREAAELAALGADFIGLDIVMAASPGDAQDKVRSFAAAIGSGLRSQVAAS